MTGRLRLWQRQRVFFRRAVIVRLLRRPNRFAAGYTTRRFDLCFSSGPPDTEERQE